MQTQRRTPFAAEDQRRSTTAADDLEHIAKAKAAVGIPIIASLNGSSPGGWTRYAKKIEEAGADALELNIYTISADPEVSAAEVAQTYCDLVSQVKEGVSIPVAVKLPPYLVVR